MDYGIESVIEEIRLFNCGYCINRENLIYRNGEKVERNFNAISLLIKHRHSGYILVDTGYSEKIYNNGFMSYLYNKLNKTIFKEDDFIVNKLQKIGLEVNDIESVIISHLHPDHIGAIDRFYERTLYMSKNALEGLKSKNPLKVIFKNMSQEININKIKFIENFNNYDNFKIKKYFNDVYDIVGDGSILIVPLEGHAKGQIGVFVEEAKLFFIADSSWSSNELERDIKFIPRLIQADYTGYKNTLGKLVNLKKEYKEIKFIASHDKRDEGIIYGRKY